MKNNLFKRIYNKLTGKKPVYIDDYKFIIQKYLPENPVILEAGFCDGRDTIQMATLWKKAVIHAFEAMPALFKEALELTKPFKNIKLYEVALNSYTGKTTFYVSSGMTVGAGSVLAPEKVLEVHPTVLFDEKIEVDCITIDDWAEKNAVSRIDLMWLDLQGAEYKVLQSATKILPTVKAIFTEVSLVETYKEVVLYPEFRKWLEARGFTVVYEDLPYADMGNVLFVRP